MCPRETHTFMQSILCYTANAVQKSLRKPCSHCKKSEAVHMQIHTHGHICVHMHLWVR